MARIYISPSTQEHNEGAGTYGTEEHMMNLIADVVCDYISKFGVEWKRNDPEMKLSQVVTDSNLYRPDIHFAIHSNAGDGKARGTEVLIYTTGGAAEQFAKAIYSKIEPLTPTADRGIKTRPDLYELSHTTAKACLIEVAFHDNPDDAKFIAANVKAIGTALAEGICEYFGVPSADYRKLYDDLVGRMREINAISSL